MDVGVAGPDSEPVNLGQAEQPLGGGGGGGAGPPSV